MLVNTRRVYQRSIKHDAGLRKKPRYFPILHGFENGGVMVYDSFARALIFARNVSLGYRRCAGGYYRQGGAADLREPMQSNLA